MILSILSPPFGTSITCLLSLSRSLSITHSLTLSVAVALHSSTDSTNRQRLRQQFATPSVAVPQSTKQRRDANAHTHSHQKCTPRTQTRTHTHISISARKAAAVDVVVGRFLWACAPGTAADRVRHRSFDSQPLQRLHRRRVPSASCDPCRIVCASRRVHHHHTLQAISGYQTQTTGQHGTLVRISIRSCFRSVSRRRRRRARAQRRYFIRARTQTHTHIKHTIRVSKRHRSTLHPCIHSSRRPPAVPYSRSRGCRVCQRASSLLHIHRAIQPTRLCAIPEPRPHAVHTISQHSRRDLDEETITVARLTRR